MRQSRKLYRFAEFRHVLQGFSAAWTSWIEGKEFEDSFEWGGKRLLCST